MQIQPISNHTANTNFNAKIKLVGGTPLSPKAKKLLPQNAVKRLEEKARKIGTDDDTVHISLCYCYDSEPSPDSFLNALGVPTYKITERKTSLTLTSVFQSKNMEESINQTEISGSANKQKLSAYKTIWKYLDALGEQYKTK